MPKTTIEHPKGILRWTEHFINLFFNPSTINDTVIDNLSQNELLHQMSIIDTLQEVKLAIKQINISMASELDGIPIELLHFGGDWCSADFDLITLVWKALLCLRT